MKNLLALTDQGQGISKVNGVVAPDFSPAFRAFTAANRCRVKARRYSAGQVSNESLILAQNQRWRRA